MSLHADFKPRVSHGEFRGALPVGLLSLEFLLGFVDGGGMEIRELVRQLSGRKRVRAVAEIGTPGCVYYVWC